METGRHLLISGCPEVGKTSLSITLARGIFPPSDALPKRFEGWTVTVNPAEFEIQTGVLASGPPPSGAVGALAGSTLRRTTSNSSTGSNSSGNSSKGSINITLWEDWPRKKHERAEESEEDEEEAEARLQEEKRKKEEEEEKENKARMEINRADAAQTRHILRSNSSKPNSGKSNEDEEEPSLPPCQPPRPCLSPHPSVILLCYSIVDMDSFVEAENVIYPELTERYPFVPVILVATKCDLKEREVPGSPAGMSSVSGSTLSDCSEGASLTSSSDSPRDLSTRLGFVVTSDMGLSLAKRIGASAYIECSAKLLKGVRPILQETLHALLDSLSPRTPSSLPSSPLLMAASKKKKKTSAPSFLFHSSKKKKASSAIATSRTKATSLHFIRGIGVDERK